MGRSCQYCCLCLEQMSPCYSGLEDPLRGLHRSETGRWTLVDFWLPSLIHVPKEKRTKMEPSGKKGIFVSYSETSKAYHIYVPGQRQIEISRDVTFDEDTTFLRSRESHLDVETEEHEGPHVVEDPVLDSLRADV